MNSKLIQPRSFQISPFSNEYLRCPSLTVRRSTVVDLFIAEHTLRQMTQRQEFLLCILSELQIGQKEPVESNENEIQEVKQQLEDIRPQLLQCESALARAESSFDNVILKLVYDELREDAKWFMRIDMVHDCWGRGGCCGRDCGCCEKRDFLEKGAGHCTADCWCCNKIRSSGPPQTKEEIEQSLRTKLEDPRAIFLVNMANWFFTPRDFQLDPRIKQKPEDLIRSVLDTKTGK